MCYLIIELLTISTPSWYVKHYKTLVVSFIIDNILKKLYRLNKCNRHCVGGL